MIAIPMPASPQNSSSLAIGSVRPVSSAQNWPRASKLYRPMLGRLLDDRPGGLLALVPLRRGGPDHSLGEAVDPLSDVLLVLVQLERELGPLCSAPAPSSSVATASASSGSSFGH